MIMRDVFFGLAIWFLSYNNPIFAFVLLFLYIIIDEGTKK